MTPDVMLKFAVKREQSQTCLNYAEREQIEQSLNEFSMTVYFGLLYRRMSCGQ